MPVINCDSIASAGRRSVRASGLRPSELEQAVPQSSARVWQAAKSSEHADHEASVFRSRPVTRFRPHPEPAGTPPFCFPDCSPKTSWGLLQNVRLGTWEPGRARGLRQGATRPIREFKQLLRKLLKADHSGSGATPHQLQSPTVRIGETAPGRIMTKEQLELEEIALVAAPEPEITTQPLTTRTSLGRPGQQSASRAKVWPDYARRSPVYPAAVMAAARPKHGGLKLVHEASPSSPSRKPPQNLRKSAKRPASVFSSGMRDIRLSPHRTLLQPSKGMP
jgi:hypothetical protein